MADLYVLLKAQNDDFLQALRTCKVANTPVFFDHKANLLAAICGKVRPTVLLEFAANEFVSEILATEPTADIYMVSEGVDATSVKSTFEKDHVCGVVNGATLTRPSQWEDLLTQIFAAQPDFSDLKSLVGGTSQQQFTLPNSSERTFIMDKIEAGIVAECTGYGEDVARIFSERAITLADELMLNAVFNANPAMKGVDRSLPYPLDENSQVTVEFAAGPKAFAVAVTDKFGHLQKSDVVKHICNPNLLGRISDRVSGGLGLRLAFEGASQLIFDVQENVSTRVVVVTFVVPSQRQFRTNPKSLCFFSRAAAP